MESLMTRSGIRLLLLLLLLTSFAGVAAAGEVAIITRVAGNAWQFESAEKVLINGKGKIRTASAGETQVRADEYKKLPLQIVGQAALRSHANGCLAYRAGGSWAPVFPDGAQSKTTVGCVALWQSARIEVFKEKNSKAGTEVAFADLFAILPGSNPSDAAVDFLMDPSNFTGVGEKDESAAFEERMSLLVGVASLANEAAAAKLKRLLLSAMDSSLRECNGAIARLSTLEQGLQFAVVSEKAFPADAEQKRARDQLRDRKAWLERRIAILKALNAGEYWDQLIDKYNQGDQFERFDNSFPEVRGLLLASFTKSAQTHLAEGKQLSSEQQYQLALQEFKIALLRKPGDREILDLLDNVRVKEARDHASKIKSKPLDVRSAEYSQISRSLKFAENYIRDGKLKQADEELASAERIDKDLPEVVLTRVKFYQARNDLSKALEALDAYDRRVNEDIQIKEGNDLRNQIVFDLKDKKEKIAVQLPKAEGEGNYDAAFNDAALGAQLDPTDAQLLYHAGLNAAILRKEAQAKDYLTQYLKVSQAIPTEAKARAEVFSDLAMLNDLPKQEQSGKQVFWFSGYRGAPGLFYCPVSLVAGARPMEVKGSPRKQTVLFNWKNGQLVSVATSSNTPGENDTTIYFDYFPDGKGVRRLDTKPLPPQRDPEPAPRLTSEGVVGAGPGTYFALFNNPRVNPFLAEKLTGKRVAILVAGNPYFHPFVWTGIHTFLAEYDATGHVLSAKEINVKYDAPHSFTFEWQGDRLMSIKERGDTASSGDYQREMHYSDAGMITGETVTFRGKNSKIEYKYEGGQLAEAICDADASIDGRSRRVLFQR